MLETLLKKEIQERGPLSQSRFMELALQHPKYGYYRTHEGVARDFTTSPEISQVFGELLGAWVIDCYKKLHRPKTLSLIELGPGRGTLMVDLLRVAKLSKSLIEALHLYLVEMNPLLKEAQSTTIPFSANWVESLNEIPLSSEPIILIANEFFDVLPTNCYLRKENKVYERRIGISKGRLSFTFMPLGESQGPDQMWEESPEAENLMLEICKRLIKQQGACLCIDYGYEEGEGESLQALFQGKPSNPLLHIGESDLTCHVNFGKLKDIALSQGLGVMGPIGQGKFLKNIGIDLRIDILKKGNPSQKASLEAAALRLTHPQHMGTLFKAMVVFSPLSLHLLGFDA